ncbi:MAG: GGDEF domain-containing protein [Betaproteobacteria bacterium]|nr:GGDEF domain-containing protein [Betaproteobacteria bacterium]
MPNRLRVRRSVSLRRALRMLVVFSVLPTAIVGMLLAYANYRLQRESVEQQTVLVVRAIQSDLEREMAAIESALKTLATAPELENGNLQGFYQRATQALGSGSVLNYILTDREGRQVLNTLLPFGTALPTRGTPVQLGKVFDSQTTVLTDMFTGVTTKANIIAMGVPVVSGGKVLYSLNIGLTPDRINNIIARHPMPEGWLVAVLDSSRTIVGRSREPERFVGQKAVSELVNMLAQRDSGFMESVTKENIPVFTAFSTSTLWGWTVVSGAPKAELHRELLIQLAQVMAGLLAALMLGLWLARRAGLKVLSSVGELNDAALALGRGDDITLPTLELQEAQAVGTAMLQAADAMRKVKFFAQHDALTELPNRLLFDELAQRSMSMALRRDSELALLALDLDGFKAVNDSLGHSMGDEVLKTVALRIVQTIRGSDVAARIGGDEFIILLSEVSAETAMHSAERLVDVLSAPYPGVGLPLGGSIGVAMFTRHGTEMKTLMLAADRALYAAKASGKGRAVLASG